MKSFSTDNNSTKNNVVITASHTCITDKKLDPGCDSNSLRNARIIQSAIPDSMLFSNDTLRIVCDDNRPWCRDTEMRKDLTKTLTSLASLGKSFIVLDIHGFPDGKSFGLSNNPEVVILVVIPNKLNKQLATRLSQHKVSYEVLKGGKINDIVITTEAIGGMGALIEIREDIPSDRIGTIAVVIKMAVDDVI